MTISNDIKPDFVAKGYTRKDGINYKETFSPISKKYSLCVIMALVAYYDFVTPNGCENNIFKW